MRDFAILAVVVALVPIIMRRPWTGILVWYWVGLMAPHALTWGFMRSFPIAALLGAVTLVMLVLTKDRRPLPMKREVILMLLFAAHITLTSVFAIIGSDAFTQWEKVMKILLMTFATPILIFGQSRIIWLLLTMTLSLGFYGFKGGVFAVSTGGSYMVLGPPGTFLEGNTFVGIAMIMVLPLIWVSGRFFMERWVILTPFPKERWYPWLGRGLQLTFWLTAIAILATSSRGALLGLLTIAPFLFWRMKRKWLLIVLAVFAIGIVGVSAPERLMNKWETIGNYQEDQSAMQRIQAWGVNWNMALDRPLMGMGFGNASMGYRWWITYANFEGVWSHVLSPHSVYFGILGQHGFIGLGIFLALLATTFATLNRIRVTAKKLSGQLWLSEYAWAIQIGLLGYAVSGIFLDVAYFDLLYAFVAVAIVLRRHLQTLQDQPSNQNNGTIR